MEKGEQRNHLDLGPGHGRKAQAVLQDTAPVMNAVNAVHGQPVAGKDGANNSLDVRHYFLLPLQQQSPSCLMTFKILITLRESLLDVDQERGFISVDKIRRWMS